jgi:hypothetical protein
MPEVNYDWVRLQMQEAKVKVGVGNAILKLLKTWEDLKRSETQMKEVVETFPSLALNHSIIPQPKDEKWTDAQPGAIKVGDEVRVKDDAYTGSTGTMHNGRRGRVVAVRYGDIIFKSNDNKEPVLDGTHYAPYQLQKRVQ